MKRECTNGLAPVVAYATELDAICRLLTNNLNGVFLDEGLTLVRLDRRQGEEHML